MSVAGQRAFLDMTELTAVTDLVSMKESSIVVSECEVAKQFLAKEFDPECHKDLLDLCRILYPFKATFPNVYRIYAEALTIGVSIGTCEASFSMRTRLLMPYRRSMMHSQKANLVLLSFQSQYASCVPRATQLSVAVCQLCRPG